MGNYIPSMNRLNIGRSGEDSDGGTQAYLYPPKSGGAYFTPHFILGGERFETSQPEMYLFGENMDLNFLGGKPAPFPYAAPAPHEPTRTLRSLINIRKESVRFIKVTKPDYIPIIKLVPNTDIEIQKPPSCDTKGEDGTITIPNPHDDQQTAGKKKSHHILKRQSSKSNNSGQNSNSSSSGPSGQPATTVVEMTSLKPSSPESNVPPAAAVNLQHQNHHYNIEFLFDADVKTAITIYYFATEEMTPKGVIYSPKIPGICSETTIFKKGSNQLFSCENHVFSPFVYCDDDLVYRAFDENGLFDPKVPFPIVIQAVALEGPDPKQSHALIAVVEKTSTGSGAYSIKPFIQKMFIDGLYYLLQEIYGIENKTVNHLKSSEQYISPDDDMEDTGSECVVCLSDSRDTLILPCRHLCLCNACADSLRYQANNCPICRAPFRALLQLKAVRKLLPPLLPSSTILSTASNPLLGGTPILGHHHSQHHTHHGPNYHGSPIVDQNNQQSCPANQNMLSGSVTDMVDVPPGYESYPLIEALNGPNAVNHPASAHGMYAFRSETETRTPTSGRRSHNKGPKNPERHRIHHSHHHHHHSSVGSADHELPNTLRRAATSTPEVVVSGRIDSPPDKSGCLSNGDPNMVDGSMAMDLDLRNKWKVPNSNRIPARKTSDDHESTSSAGSGMAQETTRLLEKELTEDKISVLRKKSLDLDQEYQDSNHESQDRTTSPSKKSAGHKKGPKNSSNGIRGRSCSPKLPKELSSVSPVSVGVAASGSYAIISLRDGLDERKLMTDDENGSSIILSNIRAADDQSDDDEANSKHLFVDASSSFENVSIGGLNVCGSNHSFDSPDHQVSMPLKNMRLVKLAESEPTDDLDMSPAED